MFTLREIKRTTTIKHKKILESVHSLTKKRSNEYVTIHIYDREVTWIESISDSFDITLSNNDTQINFADIVNV